VVRTSENDIARAEGEGNIYFMVRTTTLVQSVYPDIALYISNYCVYWIEDTQNIHFWRNQETLTETAILGINKNLTYRQMNICNVLLIRIIEGVLKFLLMLI
jgi:hypothetical protein